MAEALKGFAGSFAKGFIQMSWQDQGMTKGINGGNKRLQQQLSAILQRWAPQIESSMKQNAPWTDQTGNARNGLAARAYDADEEHGIVLFHQVPYGIWLEVKWSGRYAIIAPSLEEFGPKVMASCVGILER